MAASYARLRTPLVTPFTLFLAVLVAIGAYFIAQRFLFGLGPVTNLSPGYPWGIWVVGDTMVGTALGCGGYVMAILVYIFNGRRYHALMRPAILAGLLGYSLGGIGALIDLGRYWNFYHVFLPGFAQPYSIVFETAFCLVSYTLVLWILFLPVVFERFGWTNLQAALRPFLFFFLALGVILPTMHQSSFGTMLLVIGSKLSPLWYSEWIALYYLISALAMGFSVVMFEATVASHYFRLPSEHALLSRVAAVVGWLIGAFLLVRYGELIAEGHLGLALAGDTKAFSFLAETALFLTAFAIFVSPGGRRSERLCFLGALALLLGACLYRVNAVIIGVTPLENWSYFPSVPELMITIGIVALEVLLYLVAVKLFPVFHADGHASRTVKA